MLKIIQVCHSYRSPRLTPHPSSQLFLKAGTIAVALAGWGRSKAREEHVSTTAARPAGITDHESEQVERANASGRTPVVFIHGLWLLPSSWDRWAEVFEESGYSAVKPGWPDDPETVADAKAHPEVFAGKTVGQVADHFAGVIGKLTEKPAVIGHPLGGLL